MWVTSKDYKRFAQGAEKFNSITDLPALLEAFYCEREVLVGIDFEKLSSDWQDVCLALKEECPASTQFKEYVYQKLPSVSKHTLDVMVDIFENNP